jgi:predicted nucleic acid-binding protein
MIAYFDSSAIVKLYVAEAGSELVRDIVDAAEVAGTSVISRAEVSAAFAKAVRVRLLTRASAANALQSFSSDWNDFMRIPLTEALVARAASLAWQFHLRGYDSVQLASALVLSEMLGHAVSMITFDDALRAAAKKSGLAVA